MEAITKVTTDIFSRIRRETILFGPKIEKTQKGTSENSNSDRVLEVLYF